LRHLGANMEATPGGVGKPDKVTEISQYGIAWRFDSPREAGRYVTGDWWVVGPVTVVSVTPSPGEADPDEPRVGASSIYGAPALRPDTRMRNGSTVNPKPAEDQGYDSRAINYNPAKSAVIPLALQPGDSLVSTVSATAVKVDSSGEPGLATPYAIGLAGLSYAPEDLPLALKTAAILSVVATTPPPDAFRPAYSGGDSKVYREQDIVWDLLPALQSPASTPPWNVIERLFERPWLDHDSSWIVQYWAPGDNQPNYGREFARCVSIASLMLMLDVPIAQKCKLTIELIQLGIDLHGLAMNGRQWYSDGGHWQGRKWPILLASLLLGDEQLRSFPLTPPNGALYCGVTLAPVALNTTTVFQEDLDTYYGVGGNGQSVLWQIVFHSKPRSPYQEKARAEYDSDDTFMNHYQSINASSWIGISLAARWMGAVKLWNHDAFFDYVDQWMTPIAQDDVPSELIGGATRAFDPFVEDMWNLHRDAAPVQPLGDDNMKWTYMNASGEPDGAASAEGMWVTSARPVELQERL